MVDPTDTILHWSIDHPFPDQWVTDWEDEPLRFKTYRDRPVRELPPPHPAFDPSPCFSGEAVGTGCAELQRLSDWLCLSMGLQSTRQPLVPQTTLPWVPQRAEPAAEGGAAVLPPSSLQVHRFVPSGGGLHPCEMYILWGGSSGLPAGIYHYNPAMHALDTIATEVCRSTWTDCFGALTDGEPFAVAVISVVYWKNYFKYANACVRLLGMDAGIVLGQAAWAARVVSLAARKRYRFADVLVAQLCGFDLADEAAQAVLVLHDPARPALQAGVPASMPSSAAAAPTLGVEDVWQRSRWPRSCVLARWLNEAAALTPRDLRGMDRSGTVAMQSTTAVVEHDDAQRAAMVLRLLERQSGIDPLRRHELSAQGALALVEAMCEDPEADDLDPCSRPSDFLTLRCIVLRVIGHQPGVYRHDPSDAAFQRRKGLSSDAEVLAAELQRSYAPNNICLATASMVVVIVADISACRRRHGARALRLLDLGAGAAAQRAGLCALEHGVGIHALYGFDSRALATVVDLDPDDGFVALAIAFGSPVRDAGLVSLPLWP
jgi:SagB-type dehydrogenase family enzyme